jgi:hypothetical protein
MQRAPSMCWPCNGLARRSRVPVWGVDLPGTQTCTALASLLRVPALGLSWGAGLMGLPFGLLPPSPGQLPGTYRAH